MNKLTKMNSNLKKNLESREQELRMEIEALNKRRTNAGVDVGEYLRTTEGLKEKSHDLATTLELLGNFPEAEIHERIALEITLVLRAEMPMHEKPEPSEMARIYDALAKIVKARGRIDETACLEKKADFWRTQEENPE
ncbi:MAG: hypothetical protein HY291_05465 [Planctomycetes bacterium]|nr:hypothetical protein [Planctomycetota bacterium]